MSTEGHSYVGRLKDKKKKNERKIKELEDKLKEHEEPKISNLQEEIRRLQEEIRRLQEEIRRLQEEIRRLQEEKVGLRKVIKNNETKIGELERSNEFQEAEIGDLKKQLKEHDQKFKEIELSEDELIIRQLCSKVQENILKIVLQEHFKEKQNKSIEDIEDYIELIEDENDQKETMSRWEEFKKKIKWKNGRIKVLKSIKNRGNKTAHPKLTEEKIDAAKFRMKDDLTEDMVKAVDYLKNTWKETSRMLPRNG